MWLWLLLACGGPQREALTDTPVSVTAPPTITPPAPPGDPISPPVTPPPAPAVGPGASTDARSAYTRMRGRVEDPEKAGECKSDAECAPAGCSREVCTTLAGGREMMSTCEVLPLFASLDACGCHEGACTWTLKAGGLALQPLGVPGDAPQ